MKTWKTFVLGLAVVLTAPGTLRADRHLPALPTPRLADGGMYAQDWLYESSFDLRADLAAAAKEGKRLVVFWEQKECLYCQPMYEINLRIPRIVEKITNNFNVVKLDVLGGRKITDLDGTSLTESDLAGKSRVFYTPTLQFLPESLAKAAGMNAKESEVFRSEGYFKPFHFYFLFHYVQSKGYESQPNFQRWLGNIGKDMQAKGIRYDLWADGLPPDLPNEY